ncbi:MAG TPA: hypothetical protein VHU88_20940 [Sporichthyaceae bacterium]|nr:hypothetical protein [Sporichthyaceae bacterium]
MYIDNGDPGDSGELQIDVDGHGFTEQENYSYAQDEVVDSYELTEANGDHLVYTDDDHSGTADLVTEYDTEGDELRQAHFDAGHWVESGNSGAPTAGDPTAASTGDGDGSGETISVDTPSGEHSIGPATVDTNHDGKPDTAVVTDANGDTIMYTDTTGDGQADVATEITADGHVIIAEHTGEHTWTEEQTGHLDGSGQYHQDAGASGSFDPQLGATGSALSGGPATQDAASDRFWSTAPSVGTPSHGSDGSVDGAQDASDSVSAFNGHGVVRIDAATGQWISPN